MNYLVIEGNIGAGKTTLVEKLSADLGARAVYEQFEDNPFLPKFYNEPERYAFPTELSFLADRYNQQKKELSNRDIFAPMVIADYYFSKSLIFAGITLAEDEYRLYRQLYDIIHQKLPRPDLYVYLHCSTDKLVKNIYQRGRDYERNLNKSYLHSLQEGYFSYFRSAQNIKILIIDMEKLDFLENQKDYDFVRQTIFGQEYKNGITRIINSNT